MINNLDQFISKIVDGYLALVLHETKLTAFSSIDRSG